MATGSRRRRHPIAAGSWAVAALLVALAAAPARAQVDALVGRAIVDARVEVAGAASPDPQVTELVETRIGEPLSMHHVRASIDHLIGLGRFEDVRVVASPVEGGVTVRWSLVPVRRIGRVVFAGNAGVPVSALGAEIDERFGTAAPAARAAEMAATAQAYLAERGFRSASVAPRLVEGRAPALVDLRLEIASGPRTTVGAVSVTGEPLESPAALLKRLGLAAGRPVDRPAITRRVEDYEESLRERGYYEARVRESVTYHEDETAAVVVDVTPGPRVRIVFAGDALPEGNRETLVPIRAERSVDQDLVEDASRNIETALRRLGYRSARAPSSRETVGDELLLTFTVTRGPLHRVGIVTVEGADSVASADLQPLLALPPGSPFADSRVTGAGAALAEFFRVRGFSQVAVTPDVQVLPEATRDGVSFRPVDVRFLIREGPRTLVRAVAVHGAPALDEAAISGAVTLVSGQPFHRQQVASDRDGLERALRNAGYQTATVTAQLSFAEGDREVDVAWMVRAGPQVRVDRILVAGNDRTRADLIRRELAFAPGDPLSEEAIVESQRRLAALGLFRRVRITEPPRAGDTTRDVLVEVEEADTTTVTYGGGFEVGRRFRQGQADEEPGEHIDVAPRGFIDVSRRNLWGKNRVVTLFGRVTLRRRDPASDNPDPTDTGGYGLNDYRGFFSFREPRAFGTPGDAQVTAFVEQGIRTSFNFNRRGVAADYGRRFGRTSVSGRYTFDYTKLFDEKILAEDQLLIDRLFPQVKLSKFFGAVLRDARDDVIDPQTGSVVGVDVSVAARALGSEVGFVKTFMQGFVYRRLPGRGYVVALGARVGLATGFAQAVPPVLEIATAPGGLRREVRAAVFPSEIRDLPASERFFAGGDTTVRGFSLDRLGSEETLDPRGYPQGGNGLAVFNVELRAPYWKGVQAVGFIDAGNVFKAAGDMRVGDLRVATGIGLRYRSPIGPIRVDWGFKVHPRLLATGGRERANVLHISLGQAF